MAKEISNLLKEATQGILTEDTLNQIQEAFDHAVNERVKIHVEKALTEMLRVTKKGGRIVICEFSTPTIKIFKNIYMEYLMKALPAIAKKTSSNPDAYEYLADSIRAWPNQQDFSSQLKQANWDNVEWKNLTGGIVAIHKAEKSK